MNPSAVARRDQLEEIARRAMIQRGLRPDFSPGALREVRALGDRVSDDDPSIRDQRALSWCSIDNDDSRDLDQLSVAVPVTGETIRILVAIADVDAAVPQGSEIDRHAANNTTSVYTAAGVFPMLPERLSTDLTSLVEGEDRLAVVVDMTVAADATIQGTDVYRARVHNRAKLAYDSVAAWLDGRGQAPARLAAVPGLDEQLRIQDRVAQKLRAARHEQGALSLETIAVRPVFDGDVLTDLRPDQKNRAKELIEDFMIAANGTTARLLRQKRFPVLRRVLRSPDRWERIVALAADLSERLPIDPDSGALSEFLVRRRRIDPLRFPDLSLSVIKLLGSGEYAVERPGHTGAGHFGLAVRDYAHSTAPNRRFPDLVTQRLLKAALAGAPVPYSDDELGSLARHCTAQEDDANKVERQVSKSAAALLLAPRLHERFDAIVTGASDKGTWVRILGPCVEGRVVHGFEDLDVGDRVEVELVHTDVERGFIDFARVGDRAR